MRLTSACPIHEPPKTGNPAR